MLTAENTLLKLFEFQRFAGNARLGALISQTEKRTTTSQCNAYALSDEELEIWAAGDPDAMKTDEHDFFIESDDDE